MLGSQAFLRHWPDAIQPAPRIFFVCKSKARIRNLQDWLSSSKLEKEYNFTLHEYLNADIISAPVWWKLRDDVDGPGRAIFPKKQSASRS
jgi:hypothetical protein